MPSRSHRSSPGRRGWRDVFLAGVGASILALSFVACGPGVEPSGPDDVAAEGAGAEVGGGGFPADRGCVERFTPGEDLFPDKAEIRWAKGFSVSYHGHYKVLEIHGPTPTRLALVRCGAPAPEVEMAIIEVPIPSLATASTTELAHLEALDVVDRWVAHADLRFVSSSSLREVIATGAVAEIGGADAGHLDVERLVQAAPTVLFVDTPERAQSDSLRLLGGVGTTVVPFPTYLEEFPLGRTEWLLATSLFFNSEARAKDVFAEIEASYLGLKRRVGEEAQRRPTVLTSGPWQGVWYVPAGESFMARLLADGGADYLWSSAEGVGTLQLDIEAVFARARGADYWLFPSHWRSLGEIESIDTRLTRFAAFKSGSVFAPDRRLNDTGGNDYWELGVFRPDLVLGDVVSVLHPEILPDHKPTFLRRLERDPPP
ncbi:MAG: ABC transporter substrate-binding protein [Acidobacteriota bacterium]